MKYSWIKGCSPFGSNAERSVVEADPAQLKDRRRAQHRRDRPCIIEGSLRLYPQTGAICQLDYAIKVEEKSLGLPKTD